MRYGDFTNKRYIYKFYKNGYTSSSPKYITAGQYIDLDYTVNAIQPIYGTAFATATYSDVSPSITINGNGVTTFGLDVEVTANTDEARPIDIDGVTAIFSHAGSSTDTGSADGYYIKLFDYKILYTKSGNTLKLYYKAVQLQSVTMSSSYTYIRMRESGGIFYIDRSSDGITWTNWDSHSVSSTTDTLSSTFQVWGDMSATGTGTITVTVDHIDISDKSNNLLAIESKKILSELEYTETINNPASTTNVKLDYSPNDIPDHASLGNYVEIYTYFENNHNITYEPILDENSNPILDENSEEIYGGFFSKPIPDSADILKFSGYIDEIEEDYDDNTITLTVISHGEGLANILMSDGTIVNNNVIEQLVQNTSEAQSGSLRQTFTPQSNVKLDGVRLRISSASGGSMSVSIMQVINSDAFDPVLATSHAITWSGSLAAGVQTFTFADSLYLDAGTTYAIFPNGSSTWYYQNTDVYTGGSKQQFSAGLWSNQTGDIYFEIYTSQENVSFDYSGTITGLVETVFDVTESAYSPLFIEDVDEPGYNVTMNVTLDTTKDVLENAQKLSPARYWYSVDLGTGGYRLKEYPTEADHTLVLGRDFTGFKLKNSISDIVNDFVFTGGDINEAQDKLSIRTIDDESIGLYKRGLEIQSNEKVTTYASAQLISDYEIESNNAPRQTTEIIIPASKYDIETIRTGDLIKIFNTNNDLLTAGLQVANTQYTPYKVTISLDNAPRVINTTVDKIRRDLSNTNNASVSGVV